MGLLDIVVSEDGDRPFTVALADPMTVRGRVVLEDAPEEIAEPENEHPMFPSHNVARVSVRGREHDRVFFECQSDTGAFYGSGEEQYFELLSGPGLCRLSVSGPPGSYVAGMSLDGRPLERPEIRIGPRTFEGDLRVRLRFDVGEVRGRVEDAAPDSRVYLIPAGGDAFASTKTAMVERDRSFRVEAPPGSWKAVAARSPNLYPPVKMLLGLRDGPHDAVRVEVKPGQVVELAEPLP